MGSAVSVRTAVVSSTHHYPAPSLTIVSEQIIHRRKQGVVVVGCLFVFSGERERENSGGTRSLLVLLDIYTAVHCIILQIYSYSYDTREILRISQLLGSRTTTTTITSSYFVLYDCCTPYVRQRCTYISYSAVSKHQLVRSCHNECAQQRHTHRHTHLRLVCHLKSYWYLLVLLVRCAA